MSMVLFDVALNLVQLLAAGRAPGDGSIERAGAVGELLQRLLPLQHRAHPINVGL